MAVNVDAPAQNTQAQKKKAASKATTAAIPTAPMVSSRSKTGSEGAMTVESIATKQNHSKLIKRMDRPENKVHQAMVAMDTTTGKLLNYKQLMKDPKYKKKWSNSSANDCGRLANSVGGRTKFQPMPSNLSGNMKCPRPGERM
jgi:hypothetical protein